MASLVNLCAPCMGLVTNAKPRGTKDGSEDVWRMHELPWRCCVSFILMSGQTCAQVAGAAGACGALCDGRGGLHAARGLSGRCAHGRHLQTHPGLSKENPRKGCA